MMQGQKRKKAAFVIVLLMILAVATTRGVTLMHNSYLHPDENVFVSAARSLKDRLMGIEDFYVEAKEYPEGAYVFQAPFHILAELFLRATGHKISGFISSRVASVTYFTFAAVIGCFMIFRWIDSRPAALGAYALIIVFSLISCGVHWPVPADDLLFFCCLQRCFVASRRQSNIHWRLFSGYR